MKQIWYYALIYLPLTLIAVASFALYEILITLILFFAYVLVRINYSFTLLLKGKEVANENLIKLRDSTFDDQNAEEKNDKKLRYQLHCIFLIY